jgi:hypothetical protein
MLSLLAGIAWDPQIRGYLTVAVAVVILMGSIYLILATNVATRLGFLIVVTGLFGWMMIMGATWWIYGIGMKGEAPTWEVEEIHYGDLATAANDRAAQLDTSELPDHNVLDDAEPAEFERLEDELEPTLGGGWVLLAPSNPARGEAQAVVDAFLKDADITLPTADPAKPLAIDSTEDYETLYAFEQGGKDDLPDDPDRIDRITHEIKSLLKITHPVHYAIIQVQPVVPQETEPGSAPPTPIIDDTKPVITVLMTRNLGDLRFPSAMITIGSGLIFGLLCNMLHRRDRMVAAVRANPVPART